MDDLSRTLKVREVGGTLCVTIPAPICRQWQLRKGMKIRMKPHYVDEGTLGGGPSEPGRRRLVSITVRKA